MKNGFLALRYYFILICQAFCADSSVKCNDMTKVLTRGLSTLTAKSFLEIREGPYYWSSSTRIFLFRSRERWTVLLTKKVAHPKVCYHYSGRIPQRLFTLYSIIRAFPRLIYAAMAYLIVRKCFRANSYLLYEYRTRYAIAIFVCNASHVGACGQLTYSD